ncbi:TIGR01841 family phasin [Algicella marina]|nr:TIGR01841 family phasin [Algicella marina]
MKEFLEKSDFTKHFSGLDMKSLDPQTLFDAQKKNMDAMMAANAAAANGFQDLYRKQLQIFEDTIAQAREQVATMTSGMPDAKKATAQSEVMKAAFQKALANMQELAETAQSANEEAYKAISERVGDSVKELQDIMNKIK